MAISGHKTIENQHTETQRNQTERETNTASHSACKGKQEVRNVGS